MYCGLNTDFSWHKSKPDLGTLMHSLAMSIYCSAITTYNQPSTTCLVQMYKCKTGPWWGTRETCLQHPSTLNISGLIEWEGKPGLPAGHPLSRESQASSSGLGGKDYNHANKIILCNAFHRMPETAESSSCELWDAITQESQTGLDVMTSHSIPEPLP